MKLNLTTIMLPLMTIAALLPGKAMAAETEEPIITLTTNVYQESPSGSYTLTLGTDSETTYYDIDFGNGLEEAVVEPWTVADGAVKGTNFSFTPNEAGYIKIYGDASQLSLLMIDGAFITGADLSSCTNLSVLSLQHNSLKALDLTPLTNLMAIYLSDNPFSAATPLKVGGNKPKLQILEIDIIDHLDQSFNLSDYPALVTFDAYHNTDLWNLDPTGCPNLTICSLEMTNVSELDVSHNPNLSRLNISESRITSIDLSKNTELQHFLAGHFSGNVNTEYYLKSVDLSKNPNLAIVDLTNNRLESIDVSNNPAITHLYLKNNRLTSIDLSKNTNLYSVYLSGNNMDFSTLPLPKDTWGEYFYLQQPMSVDRSVAKGAPLDLSKRVLREGTTTTAKVFSQPYDGEAVELDPTYYTYENGIITFNTVPTDSVYVQYSNTTFADYNMYTKPFKVKEASEIGKPTKIASFNLSADYTGKFEASVGLAGASAETPKEFMVDFGDGTLVKCSATSAQSVATPNVTKEFSTSTTGRVISVYIPEGEVMTSLSIKDMPLESVDLSKATELTELTLVNCSLTDIDLAYNRCLRTLDIHGNKLTKVDLSGIYGNYEKNMLQDIDASDNQLTEFKIVAMITARNLDLSNNRLTTYSLKDFDNLESVDLSNNQLEGEFSLTYQGNAKSIDLSGNNITSLVYDTFANLNNLDISDNKFTIATLPYMPSQQGYIYAPQKPYQLYDKAPSVNLCDQNRVLGDGNGTSYVWKKASGETLVEGVDVKVENGAAKFLKADLGKVYCEMSNPAFPEFKGSNIYRTTETEVVGAPTTIVATFTTMEDGTGDVTFTANRNTQLYIDWRGDGSEFVPYDLTTTYIRYADQRTFAGAKVKVYTYENPTDITVFSISGMPLADFDATPLTNLINLTVSEAGLTPDKLKLPDCPGLMEFCLDGNALTEYPYSEKYPDIVSLSLIGNKLTSFDASPLKKLQVLSLGKNEISSVTFDNPVLWSIDLQENKLTNFTAPTTGLGSLSQLFLSNNLLTEVNLMSLRRNLCTLYLTGNRLTFATLPQKYLFRNLTTYYCGNQEQITPETSFVDGHLRVDLSSQAMVNDAATEYIWYLGEPVYNSEEGTLTGETLLVDDEYTIADGVTTFNESYSEKVVCVMTNASFPGMYLRTIALSMRDSGVEDVVVETPAELDIVNVYNLHGVCVKTNVPRSQATDGLSAGIYIVGGKKVLVK